MIIRSPSTDALTPRLYCPLWAFLATKARVAFPCTLPPALSRLRGASSVLLQPFWRGDPNRWETRRWSLVARGRSMPRLVKLLALSVVAILISSLLNATLWQEFCINRCLGRRMSLSGQLHAMGVSGEEGWGVCSPVHSASSLASPFEQLRAALSEEHPWDSGPRWSVHLSENLAQGYAPMSLRKCVWLFRKVLYELGREVQFFLLMEDKYCEDL